MGNVAPTVHEFTEPYISKSLSKDFLKTLQYDRVQ